MGQERVPSSEFFRVPQGIQLCRQGREPLNHHLPYHSKAYVSKSIAINSFQSMLLLSHEGKKEDEHCQLENVNNN